MNYAVIMAGGSGRRLWPLSRKTMPKQVLKLFDDSTLLNLCFNRLIPLFDVDKIIVLTNKAYVQTIRDFLPQLPADNVIAEPAVRDTSAAIGLAAAVLNAKDKDATMTVVTADHIIEPVDIFQQTISDAATFVDNNPGSIVTFGIQPSFASTQLGYIHCIDPVEAVGCKNKVSTVSAFKEKPDSKTAEKYLSTGEYFWNSGMFVWKAKTILGYLKKYLPESTEPLEKIASGWSCDNRLKILDENFVRIPKISIDFAVMEKASKVHAIRLDCRWFDLGSFNALCDILGTDGDGNTIVAQKTTALDAKNNIVLTEDKGHLIALIGVDDIVVAHSPDATLVCRADQTGRIKELLDMIETQHGDKYF